LALPSARCFSLPISTSGRPALASAHVQTTVKGIPMETGTVKWYNETKGYGFIQPDSGGKDVFVHATALERAGMRGLREGQKISYELQTDQRTGRASAVNLQNA
jgi:CspA family cold shock protein